MINYQRKLHRQQYKVTHPLLRFRKISPHVLVFVKKYLVPGSTVSVDSFPWALDIDVHRIYELKQYEHLFKKTNSTEFLTSMINLPRDIECDNLILCGISEFKYKNWSEVVDMVVKISTASQHKIIVAFPITVLFFHRLKYSYHAIMDQISERFLEKGLVCQDKILDIDIAYFALSKK